MTPRRPALRTALALAAALLSVAACGGSDDAPPRSTPSPTESYPIRHVFVALRADSKDPGKPPRAVAEARARAAAILRRLREPGADVEAIARAESDDAVTAPDGGFAGFLGTWSRDDPALLDAAAATAPGAWSGPVETPIGFHLVQRLSREEGKATEARLLSPVIGVLVRWRPMDTSAPETQTKSVAYEEAARTSADLRAGRVDFETALGRLQGVRPFWVVLRKANTPGYEALAEKALAAAPDVWLDPVETVDGYAVVRRRPYVRAYGRHLLVTHRESVGPAKNPDRTVEEAELRARAALERVRKDPASWDRVVAETSDEASSRGLGGFFGEVATTAGQGLRVAPEMEEAFLRLEPGAVSDVVATRFGFHVLRRDD